MLDNPAIWVSDLLFSDRDASDTGQAEEYLEKQFFTQERLELILRVIVTQYLVLTNEELQMWQEDSLKFFLHMKLESNEVKGNLLREKAKALIAGIQLRFSKHFDAFCAKVIQHLAAPGIEGVEREAMFQVLSIRINDEQGIDSAQFLQLLAPEL